MTPHRPRSRTHRALAALVWTGLLLALPVAGAYYALAALGRRLRSTASLRREVAAHQAACARCSETGDTAGAWVAHLEAGDAARELHRRGLRA